MQTNLEDTAAPCIRDLGDFCLKWPELRGVVLNREASEATADGASQTALEDRDFLAVLRWLRLLADRVCRDQEL